MLNRSVEIARIGVLSLGFFVLPSFPSNAVPSTTDPYARQYSPPSQEWIVPQQRLPGQPLESIPYDAVPRRPLESSDQRSPHGRPQQSQSLDELTAWERQDMGVAPSRTLRNGSMHGATPNQIPGGQVITTKGLVPLLQGAHGIQAVVLDVFGAPQQLPNTINAVAASRGGSFNDPTQQQLGHLLQQATRGNRDVPLVFYCQGPQCWMSYNAALRAINLGYKNVLWYRGGLEAWQRAGLPLAAVQRAG